LSWIGRDHRVVVDVFVSSEQKKKMTETMRVKDKQEIVPEENMYNSMYEGAKDWIAKSQPELARFGNSKAESPWEFNFRRN
jgi:hypothetical protein